MKRFVAALVIVFLALLGGLVFYVTTGNDGVRDSANQSDGPGKVRAVMVGEPMPALELAGWINGQPTAEDLRGKIIVLDFWAIWCPPCLEAIPELNRLAEVHAADGVAVIGIYGSKIGAEKFGRVVEQHAIRYPVGRDVDRRAVVSWGVGGMPFYVVVDRDGVVRATGLTSFAEVEAKVAALLGE